MTSQALATIKDRHTYVANALEQARPRLLSLGAGSSFEPSRAIAVALDVLSQKPELLSCTPNSIVRSVMLAAECGLEINLFGEAYLVPFDIKGVEKATMMVGYRGFVKLIRQAPRVATLRAVLVRAADTWKVDEGKNELTHVRGQGDRRQRGDVIAAYAIVTYDGGASQFEIVDRVDLDAIQSKASKRGPWHMGGATNADEMRKKTAVRRLAKWLQLERQSQRAFELDDLEAMRRGEFGALREGFETGRADDLKEKLKARTAKVEIQDAEVDE